VFKRLSFKIEQTKILHKLIYRQKQALLKRITTQIGVYQLTARTSLIGNSILELYAIEENQSTIRNRMQANGWTEIEFKPEEEPDFMKENADKNLDASKLINRLAYLYAGTTVQNLRKAFMEDISVETQMKILERVEEIVEQRKDVREGRANAKLVSQRQ
jgi:hypothetical protein